MSLVFEKYTEMGNEYLVYDQLKNEHSLTSQDVRWLCNRNFGVGLEGIIVGIDDKDIRSGFVLYHPDGTIAQIGIEAILIYAKYLLDVGYKNEHLMILDAQDGNVTVHYKNDDNNRIKVSMNRKSFISDDVGMLWGGREVVDEPLLGDKETLCTCATVNQPPCIIPNIATQQTVSYSVKVNRISKIIVLNEEIMMA